MDINILNELVNGILEIMKSSPCTDRALWFCCARNEYRRIRCGCCIVSKRSIE